MIRDSVGIDSPGGYYVAYKPFALENLGLLRIVVEEIDKIEQWADRNKQEAAKLLAPAQKIDLDVMERVINRRLKPTVQDATRQVFQVSLKGEAQFLSIIQTGNSQAIVLSDAPRSLDDLKKAVEVPPEVTAILSSLAAENANSSDFVQPDFVYTRSTAKG